MASLYRRGRVWWIKYRHRGRLVRESLDTTAYNEARREKSRIERQLDERTFQEPSLTPIKAFLEDYLALLKATRPHKSYKNDVSYLRLIFGPICAELAPHDSLGRPVSLQRWRTGRPVKPIFAEHLEDVTPTDISGFIADRVRIEEIAPKTANRTREVLHKMFAYARKHCGYVSPDAHWVNPAAPVDRISEPAPQIRFLNGRQIKEQLDALAEARPPLREMVAVLIYAGLRREELLWLTRDDADLDAHVIRVRAKSIDGRTWQPKTRRNRAIPISDTLFAYLVEYTPAGLTEWYFPFDGRKQWSADYFSHVLRETNAEAGLTWSCLDFRHTFGSQLAMKGVSLYKISALMGNSPDICRRHYAALIPEELHEAVEFDAPVPAKARRSRLRVVRSSEAAKIG